MHGDIPILHGVPRRPTEVELRVVATSFMMSVQSVTPTQKILLYGLLTMPITFLWIMVIKKVSPIKHIGRNGNRHALMLGKPKEATLVATLIRGMTVVKPLKMV